MAHAIVQHFDREWLLNRIKGMCAQGFLSIHGTLVKCSDLGTRERKVSLGNLQTAAADGCDEPALVKTTSGQEPAFDAFDV